jgi:hypothetical protein
VKPCDVLRLYHCLLLKLVKDIAIGSPYRTVCDYAFVVCCDLPLGSTSWSQNCLTVRASDGVESHPLCCVFG